MGADFEDLAIFANATGGHGLRPERLAATGKRTIHAD